MNVFCKTTGVSITRSQIPYWQTPPANLKWCKCIKRGTCVGAKKMNQVEVVNLTMGELASVLPIEDHACSTGDCSHALSSQCDDAIKRNYGESAFNEWKSGRENDEHDEVILE